MIYASLPELGYVVVSKIKSVFRYEVDWSGFWGYTLKVLNLYTTGKMMNPSTV